MLMGVNTFSNSVVIAAQNSYAAENTAISDNDDLGEPDQKTVLAEWLQMLQQNKEWSDISIYYEEHIQALIANNYSELDQWIQTAMRQAELNKIRPQQVETIVHEGILVFHYYEMLSIMHNIPELLKAGQSSIAEGLLDASFRLFKSTLAANIRDLDQIYRMKMLEQIQTVLYPSIQQSLKSQDAEQFILYTEMLNLALIKRFVVQVLHYLNEIDKAAINLEQSDNLNPLSSVSAGAYSNQYYEALLAFLPIYEKVKIEHPIQAEKVYKHLVTKQTAVPIVTLKKELTLLITMQIQSAFDNVMLKITEKNDQLALKYAAEAVFYIHALQLPVLELLKVEDYTAIEYHSDAYYNLVHRMVREKKSNGLERISGYAFKIVQILTHIKGIHIKIGEPYLWVDGELKEHEYLASFLDAETDRTWVSLRLIGEALGMKVTYQTVDKYIEMDTGNRKLKIGSNQNHAQVLNGELGKSSIAIEQPLRFVDGHAYLSMKDLVKVLDRRIIWFKGEILIL